MGFDMWKVDPCLFLKKNILLGLYVDDILVIGSDNDIKNVIIGLKKRFTITFSLHIDEFLGVSFRWMQHSIALNQTRLIDALIDSMKDKLGIYEYKTPTTPGSYIQIEPEAFNKKFSLLM